MIKYSTWGDVMSSDNHKSKIKTYIEKLTSEEASLKRIPFCLFLLGVLVCVLIFKIGETNKYLKIIAENDTPSIEIQTKDEKYDEVLNIYTEEEKKPEDILPNPYDVINKQPSSDNKDETVEPSTSVGNKQKYVINISSKKIHKPDCSFVERTKDENKKTVELSADELKEYINNGHEVCKTCGGE